MIACMLAVSLTFVSCVGSDMVTREDAEQAISNLLGTMGRGEYETAATYMHPDANSSPEKLENFDNELKNIKIDLSNGVKVKSVTGFYQTFYSTKFNGSAYELTFEAEIGNKTCTITATTVRNQNGFGIYSITIA